VGLVDLNNEPRTPKEGGDKAMSALDPALRTQLLAAARDAARSAYCPYSNFHVGAAVLMDGRLFSGCNVENASYGLTICAERVAVFAGAAAGARRIQAVAVACVDAPANSPPGERMPCGACRQVLAEFGDPDTPVLIDQVGEMRLADLLPSPFVLESHSSPA
jgi:cytidine deaminase